MAPGYVPPISGPPSPSGSSSGSSSSSSSSGSSSFVGPPAPTPQQRLNALRKRSGKSPAATTQSRIRNISVASSFPDIDVGKEIGQLKKGMKKSGTVRSELRKQTRDRVVEQAQPLIDSIVEKTIKQEGADAARRVRTNLNKPRNAALLVGEFSKGTYKEAAEGEMPIARENPYGGLPDIEKIHKQANNWIEKRDRRIKKLDSFLTPNGKFIKPGKSVDRYNKVLSNARAAENRAQALIKKAEQTDAKTRKIALNTVREYGTIDAREEQAMRDAEAQGIDKAIVGMAKGAYRGAVDPVKEKIEAVANADSLGEVAVAIQSQDNQDVGDTIDLMSVLPTFRAGRALVTLPGAVAKSRAAVATAQTAEAAAVAAANAPRSYKALQALQKFTKSPRYQKARISAGAVTGGAAITESYVGPGYTKDFIEGTAKGFIDDPGTTLETSARGLISGATFPFTLAANVGMTGSRAFSALDPDTPKYQTGGDYITAPVKRLGEEMIFETKRMIDVYTSGDVDKIAEATKNDYGLLNAMGAAYILRPAVGKSVRFAGRTATDSALGGAVGLPTLERNWNKKKLDWYASRVFGRAEGESNWILGKVTREWREGVEKLNRQPGIRAVYKKDKELYQAEVTAATKGMTPDQAKVVAETIAPVGIGDKIGWIAHKKLQPGPNLLAEVAAVSRKVEPGSADARVANAILNTPELFDGTNAGLTNAFAQAWAKARQASKVAQDAWEDTIRLQAKTPEEAAKVIAEQRRADQLEANITYAQLTDQADPIRPEAIGTKELAAADDQVLTGLKGTVANRRAALAKAEKQLKIKQAKLDTRDARERVRLQSEGRAIKAEIDKVNAEGRQQAFANNQYKAINRIGELDTEARALRDERDGNTGESAGVTDTAAKRAELDAQQTDLMEQAAAARASNDLVTLDRLNENLLKISRSRRALDSLEQSDKKAARQKPGAKRQEEIKARLEEIEKEKTVQRNERDKAKRAFGEEKKKIRAHEKRIKDLYVKPDPRLEPLRAHVQELKGRKEAAAKRVAAAIENTQAFQDEIAFRLTPAERKAAVRRADEKLGTGPDYAKIDALEAEIKALQETAKPDTLAILNAQQRLSQERGKGVKAGQSAATKVAAYDNKLKRLQEERDSLPDGEQKRLVMEEIAAITQERKLAVMDNAAALRTAEIRATIQMAEGAKKEARLREYRKQYEVVFDEFNREASEANIMSSGFFITGNEAVDPGIPSGNPGFNSVFGSPAPKVKTGSLSRSGTVDRSQKAFLDTVRKANDALANTRKTQWLMSQAVARHTTGKDKGKVIVDSKAGFYRRVKNGEIDPTGKVLLNQRMLTDPANLGPISRAVDSNDGKVTDGIREISSDDAKKYRSDEDILTDRLATEGEGDMYVLVDEGPLKIEAHMKDMPTGLMKAFYELNRFTSRVVLGTSPSWALAQPIAELLVQVSDNPNPRRLIRAYREAAANRKNPDTSVARGQAHLAGTSLGIAREYSNAKTAQKDINAALKVEREYPGWRMVKETVALEQLGKFDRWKGSLIREAGLLAELDRELSTLRRTAKAIQGNYDVIERSSGILMKMNRAEQIKWLNSREGMEAGQLLAKNLDELYGNWTDLKPGYEREIGSVVFFYPFVRFSLDWTLRTFPKRHPVRWQLATMFGQFNAEILERLMNYDPRWMNDWAVAVLYGGPDGDPTMLSPLSRTGIAGNIFMEAGFSKEGDLISNLFKAVVPLTSGAPRIFLSEKDQYGNRLSDPDDDITNPDPGMKTKVGQWIEEFLLLAAPPREILRETGYSPKEIIQGEQDAPELSLDGFDLTKPLSIFSNAPGREPKAGDDPNLTRDRIRRNLFALTPEPVEGKQQEQELDRLYRAREDAQTTARGKYPRVTFRGRKNQSLYDVGRKLAAERRAQEAEGLSGEPRTAEEKRLAKRYIKLSGMNKYGSDRVEKLNRQIVEYAKKVGAPLPNDSTIKQEVVQARYDEQDQVKQQYMQRWGGTEYPGYRQAKKMLAQTGNAGDSLGEGLSNTPRTTQASLSSGGYNYDATQPGYTPKTPITTYRDQPANTPPAERIPAGAGIEPMKNVPRKRQVAFAKKIRAQKVKAFGSGSAKISAPGLSKSQRTFAQVLAKETGLDPKVVGGWVLAEQGYASGDYEARDYHNWLNIGPHMEAPEFGSPATAAKATAAFLRGEKWGAGAGIPGILPNAVGKSPEEQVEVLRGSGWDAAGYQDGIPWQDVTATPINTGNQQQAKERFWQMVERGKRMGVYEVPEDAPTNPQATGDFSQGGKQGTSKTEWFAPDENTLLRFQPPLANALLQLAKASGEPISFNSGFRTRAEQEAAYADYQAGGALAAVPGTSNHEFGRAADVNLTDKQRELLSQFGLGLPVPGEDWHVELVGDAANAYTDGMPQSTPTSPMQQVKAAARAKAAAASGTTGGGTTGGTTSSTTETPGTQSNAINNLQNFRNPDGSILNWGTGTEMDLPSAAVNVSEASQNSESDKVKSVAESLAGLPKYVKPKPKKR
jgi:hypothetical protein